MILQKENVMLTEEEKRKIEEKERYAAEMRKKYSEANSGNTQNQRQGSSDNIMSEHLSSEMITNVVVPRLRSVLEVMNYLKESMAKLNEKSQELAKLKRQQRQPYKNKFLTGVIFVIVLYIFALEDNGAIAGKMVDKAVANGSSEYFAQIFWCLGVPGIITAIVSAIARSLIYNKMILPNLQNKIKNLQEEIMELQKTVNDYCQTNQELIKFLPEKYQNPQAVSFMLDLFVTFRVDSMKEAFNQCEELLKYDKMVSVVQSMKSTLDNLDLLHARKQGSGN